MLSTANKKFKKNIPLESKRCEHRHYEPFCRYCNDFYRPKGFIRDKLKKIEEQIKKGELFYERKERKDN